jgi:adenylate cyclase
MTDQAEPQGLEQLASLTGESVAELRRWQALGLVRADDESAAEDLQRARLIRFAARRGIPPEEVARICSEQGDMLAAFVRWAITSGASAGYMLEDVADRSGLDPELVDRVWAAAGLRDQTRAFDEDIEALRLVAIALQFGLPVEVLLQMLRVFADALGRVADAAVRAFHLHVHEVFRAEGLSGAELMAATQAIADPLTGLVEPAVLYFHRKSWERANREDLLLHLMEESTTPGELVRTLLFIDISGYTPLTEQLGDAGAAKVVARFSDIVRDRAAKHNGQIVKQIGDEFMITFPTPAAAVDFGVAVRHRTQAEPAFPGVRIGAHCGPVLFREGDYYGATVNLAARVTSTARRNEFLVTESVRQEVAEYLAVTAVGDYSLKGINGEIPLFEIEPVE